METYKHFSKDYKPSFADPADFSRVSSVLRHMLSEAQALNRAAFRRDVPNPISDATMLLCNAVINLGSVLDLCSDVELVLDDVDFQSPFCHD